jgi:hypothetical protein
MFTVSQDLGRRAVVCCVVGELDFVVIVRAGKIQADPLLSCIDDT